jgi:hypothetical protein
MKKSFLVGLTILLLVGLILAACGSSPSSSSNSRPTPQPKWAGIVLTGENEPLLEGTIWVSANDVANMGGEYNTYITTEFRARGRFLRKVRSTYFNQDYTGSWEREGNIVRVIDNNGLSFAEGRYYPETQRIMLTWESSNGDISDVTWIPFSSVNVTQNAPAPQTNVYVQPSTPAQSTAPARNPSPAPSAPTFQTGTYAWSNSGVNMTMSFNVGMVSAFLNRSGIWTGTYSINGNQLVISVTSASGDYSRLRGMTYSYTITSSTSFSGSGETWVRTGF